MLASIPAVEARCCGTSTNTSTTERPGALGPAKRAGWFSISPGERAGVGKGWGGRDCPVVYSFLFTHRLRSEFHRK